MIYRMKEPLTRAQRRAEKRERKRLTESLRRAGYTVRRDGSYTHPTNPNLDGWL